MPPTERKGRVHTSTITIAAISDNHAVDCKYAQREECDFKVEWYSGTGKGGQHRNKVKTSCRVTHIPTGITQQAQTRSRENSLQQARAQLTKTLDSLYTHTLQQDINCDRSTMIGYGNRSERGRTYKFQHNMVEDHTSGKRTTCKQILRGHFDKLWDNK